MSARGYAVLPQHLGPTALRDLTELYNTVVGSLGRAPSGSFWPSMTISDSTLRARLWDGVGRVTAPLLGPLFRPGTNEVVGGSFVSKPASPDGFREPHQDPSVFDESRFVSLSLWIPLSDSHIGNGTIQVLPGSHRMGNRIRPPDVDSVDADLRKVALAESVPLELKAGQILAIDAALVHHSPANDSPDDRVAAIVALRPSGAAMWFARSDNGAPSGEAQIYDVGTELYRSGDLASPRFEPDRPVDRVLYAPATVADLRASQRPSRALDAAHGATGLRARISRLSR